ncbi:MAG: phosphate transport system regulatory protein PhoU [Lentisphaerae bacterium GWF2_44_16]|nr:MAG: phosphate transport system regulatory protein PhoU [Lentisphaerae bacterium GWF2_44_16]
MALHLTKEIAKLKNKVLKLCALVEENVKSAVDAVTNLDIDLAISVKEKDDRIDSMEIELEEECLKILALYQPVANDLRYVIACLKMNNDLERIGDLAVNIARRAITVAKFSEEPIFLDFYPMMDKMRSMLKNSLDALIEMNAELAVQVLTHDDEIDAMNKQMQKQVLELIKKNPEKVEYYIHLLSVSRHLERIADYATNIAEDVIYMVTGKIVRHQHDTSFIKQKN